MAVARILELLGGVRPSGFACDLDAPNAASRRCGPANAKTELVKHIHRHGPKLMDVVIGVETVDHPSDAQLVAYARIYFDGADRMQSQKS